MAKQFERIIISRTDSIGDVVLTLPLAGWIKKQWPHTEIIFIGRAYTGPVIQACEHINRFVNWDELNQLNPAEAAEVLKEWNASAIVFAYPDVSVMRTASRATIPIRIATAHRISSWRYANRRVFFSRKGSNLHEAQLNFKLFEPLEINHIPALDDIPRLYGLSRVQTPDSNWFSALNHGKFKLLLHPGSKGSAAEWGLSRFLELTQLLPSHLFDIYLTGTAEEGRAFARQADLSLYPVKVVCGQFGLSQFISFISVCDGIVAASTGPLHIAAALGKVAVGLYTPQRPMHAGRWAPVGTNAIVLEAPEHPAPGRSLDISPQLVAHQLMAAAAAKSS